MPVSETQLITWSHQGSVTQSAATYAGIKSTLESNKSPFYGQTFEVFLQGSYGNDTNIFSDSDVDIVICLSSTWYSDTSRLNSDELANYNGNRVAASYGIDEFKKQVLEWLQANYGAGVVAGKKAIFVPASGNRREADVLVCARHVNYSSYPSFGSPSYDEGIAFWTQTGQKIVNYPKQHRLNCTAKHQSTGSRFKANVRVLKNMRNRMVADGYIQDGAAPSYFLEGLLWNVPNLFFQPKFSDSLIDAFDWIEKCEASQLSCANDLHWLIRDGAMVCWNNKDFEAFKKAFKQFWKDF